VYLITKWQTVVWTQMIAGCIRGMFVDCHLARLEAIMFKSAVSVQTQNRLYLFIGHPRNPFVQHLHSALYPQENLSLTMRQDSKLLDPSLHYAAYILDADYLQDAPSVIRSIRHRNPKARVVAISKSSEWESVRELFRAGAIEVLPCPANAQATRVLLEHVMEANVPGDCRV
jgi:hypothetical protein